MLSPNCPIFFAQLTVAHAFFYRPLCVRVDQMTAHRKHRFVPLYARIVLNSTHSLTRPTTFRIWQLQILIFDLLKNAPKKRSCI